MWTLHLLLISPPPILILLATGKAKIGSVIALRLKKGLLVDQPRVS